LAVRERWAVRQRSECCDELQDFNTCTLPHKKFYDLRSWEVESHAKKSAKASKKFKKEKGVPPSSFHPLPPPPLLPLSTSPLSLTPTLTPTEKGGERGGKPKERDEDIRAREDALARQKKASAEYQTELDAIALQHQVRTPQPSTLNPAAPGAHPSTLNPKSCSTRCAPLNPQP